MLWRCFLAMFCGNVVQRSWNFPGICCSNFMCQRFHNFLPMLWKRCCNHILLAVKILLFVPNIPFWSIFRVMHLYFPRFSFIYLHLPTFSLTYPYLVIFTLIVLIWPYKPYSPYTGIILLRPYLCFFKVVRQLWRYCIQNYVTLMWPLKIIKVQRGIIYDFLLCVYNKLSNRDMLRLWQTANLPFSVIQGQIL